MSYKKIEIQYEKTTNHGNKTRIGFQSNTVESLKYVEKVTKIHSNV